MFEDLKRAFREAVDNFKEELHRDEIPETVDRLLKGMHQEAADARAHVKSLEEEVRRTLERASLEEEEAATCRRRERMAREIDDGETARIAGEFAEKHEKRQRVLERKALALQEELDLRQAELAEMLARIQEARKEREGLGATAGRAEARTSIRDADDLFAELDRMAERIEETERRAEAAADLDDLDAELEAEGPEASEIDRDARAEARLRELKEKLGRE